MKGKLHFLTLLLIVLSLSMAACNASSNETSTATTKANSPGDLQTEAPAEEMILSLEDLATYNGENGQPAYVAVDGVVYDVTGIPEWTGGKHNGNLAGQDLTEQIKNAPHGTSTLTGLPIIGRLE